ncbi:TPA: hypothetical protein N3J09_004259 [Salmonella enterica subsp. enterica serovar Panama]|nr:hypothetical protein [Salmonella enterica subsp. enterica serovar Panama]
MASRQDDRKNKVSNQRRALMYRKMREIRAREKSDFHWKPARPKILVLTTEAYISPAGTCMPHGDIQKTFLVSPKNLLGGPPEKLIRPLFRIGLHFCICKH